jgi:hypothetical protein
LVSQRAEIDERIPDTQLAQDQCGETEREQRQQGLHTEEWIAEPIPLLAFAQHDFPRDPTRVAHDHSSDFEQP